MRKLLIVFAVALSAPARACADGLPLVIVPDYKCLHDEIKKSLSGNYCFGQGRLPWCGVAAQGGDAQADVVISFLRSESVQYRDDAVLLAANVKTCKWNFA